MSDTPRRIKLCLALALASVLGGLGAAGSAVGLGWLPVCWTLPDDLRRKRLVRVLPRARMPPVLVHGIYHRQSRGALAVQAVLDFLASELPKLELPKSPRPVTRGG